MNRQQTSAVVLLTRAREKIADPARWTTGVAARNANGYQIHFKDDAATCFCAFGAIERVAHEIEGVTAELCVGKSTAHDIMDLVAHQMMIDEQKAYGLATRPTFEYNDTHTHEQVLVLFDEAIKFANA